MKDLIILFISIILWCQIGWMLFKKWFGHPRRFLKSAKKARGSETVKLFEKGFASALEGQAFEFAVGAYVVINILMMCAIAALIGSLINAIPST